MKIKNETYWRTDHIRAMILRVARAQHMEPVQIRAMRIYVVWRKRRSRIGEASLGHSSGHMATYMKLFMDRDRCDSVLLAHTIAHEIGHQKGLTHRDMRGRPSFDYSPGWRDLYAWAAAFPVERRPVLERPRKAPPSPVQLAEANYEKAAAMVRTWETKIKRAQTALKKWKRRAALRQRRVAALAVQAASKAEIIGDASCQPGPSPSSLPAGPSPSDHGL